MARSGRHRAARGGGEVRVERIRWIDHHSSEKNEWRRLAAVIEAAEDTVTLDHYGVIIHETDDAVTISAEEQLETPLQLPRYRGVTTIMKALIVEREVLKEEVVEDVTT